MNENYYIIPKNYSGGRTFCGIPYRNVIEAGVMAYLFWKLGYLLPFTIMIKTIIRLLLVVIAGFIGIYGIRDESLTQYLFSYMTFKKNRRKLHIRPVGFLTERERNEIQKENKKKQRKQNTK